MMQMPLTSSRGCRLRGGNDRARGAYKAERQVPVSEVAKSSAQVKALISIPVSQSRVSSFSH